MVILAQFSKMLDSSNLVTSRIVVFTYLSLNDHLRFEPPVNDKVRCLIETLDLPKNYPVNAENFLNVILNAIFDKFTK